MEKKKKNIIFFSKKKSTIIIFFLKYKINSILQIFGYRIQKIVSVKPILELNSFEKRIIDKAIKISTTTQERQWALIQSIKYIKDNNIKGDMVECGVYKGGNIAIIKSLSKKLKINKKIFAYDTYDGMSEPSKFDIERNLNKSAKELLKEATKDNLKVNIWCYENLDSVKKNILKIARDTKNIFFVKGDVNKTLRVKKNLPKKISLLRLDTDFYLSTKVSLEILYPRLVKNGVLIIDDYGNWKGCKKAVDDYFKKNKLWLHHVDYNCRMLIKK